ncbi:MAG: hypothetical protein LKJ90_08760 [Faecalibacterium sp.]|jgi:hypothetical protein|nr:hypothetical protein [Faecalibacterium sp.]
MHKNKRGEPNEAAKDNAAEELLFHFDKKELEKKDGTVAENLARDQQFRKFFTTSVIEVPEEMRKVDRADPDNGAEETAEKKRGFFRGLFARPEEDDEEDIGVQIPEQAHKQAEETERSFAQKLEQPEDTGEIRLVPEAQKPRPRKAEPAQSTPAQPQKQPTAAARMPATEPARQAPQQAPAAKTPPVTAPMTANAAAKAPQMPPRSKKAGPVDVGSLLEKIDEVQAVAHGEEPAAEKTAAADAKKPQPPETANEKESAQTVMTLEPTAAELADRAPHKAKAETAQAPENVPTEKPMTENTAGGEALDGKPAEEAKPKATDAPHGRIVFADEMLQPTAPAAEARPTQEKKKNADEAQPESGDAGRMEPKPTEQPAPEEAAAAQGDTEEPTGEVSLLEEQPTGEIPLEDAEPTGEVPLMDEQAETEENLPPENAAPHSWQKLKNIFSGGQEPDEEPNEDADAEPAPKQPLAEEETLEYTSAEDAEAIRGELQARTAALTLRCVLSGILAVALIALDLMGQSVLPSPAIIDPVSAPAAWLGVHLILLGICIALALPILKNGVISLLPHKEPSADALATLAAVAAVLQTVVGLLQSNQFDPAKITVFSGAAALLLFADLLGQRISMDSVSDGFAVMTSGVENAAGYCLKDKHLLHALSEGMDENEPVLLLSRPGSLLKNFMAQSVAPHRSDRVAVEFARTLGVVGVIGFAVTLVKGGGLLMAVSVLAAVQCMGAPLSATLIRAIPSRLMQRAAAQVGAVVPGWPAIEQLGEVDMIHADAAELFPPMCAHLYGIKTFQKERVDLAILYATSILIESCNTLSGLFRNMIENHTDMLYPVKDLEKRPGLGFVAWCDNCRIVLGSRELMTQEGISLPAMDYENRYTQNGDRHVLYLAVSGELYAMFLYGYSGTKKVAHTLGLLRRENIRLLVTADDPTLTAARIEEAYRLRPGFVKVLSGEEANAMAPATAYQPTTEGCLVHLGGFASLAGGLQAAAGADGAEHNACTVQTVSVTVSVILGLLLSFAGGLAHISLAAVLLYQIAWSALSMALTLTKKY